VIVHLHLLPERGEAREEPTGEEERAHGYFHNLIPA
jgi:hypothetical protein